MVALFVHAHEDLVMTETRRDFERVHEKVVIRLDNRQVLYALVGTLAVSAAVFAAGVHVGQTMGDGLGLGAAAVAGYGPAGGEEVSSRRTALTGDAPSTRAVHAELSEAAPEAPPASPTVAARMEAHRQIAAARAGQAARSLGPIPVAPPEAPAPQPAAVTWAPNGVPGARSAPAGGRGKLAGFTLEVSAFDDPDAADRWADKLSEEGHEARVRELSEPKGPRFRVEVGDFADASGARRFKEDFEQRLGIATVVVPVR